MTPIHFVHGNGFTAGCYRQFLTAVESHYPSIAVDKLGHNPAYPVTDGWTFLVDELLADIRQKSAEPVIGLGHSFGGVLHLLAAQKDPSCYRAVVMIDSPLFDRLRSFVIKVAKQLGFIDNITPAGKVRFRQQYWRTHDAFHAYLKARPFFQHFDPACLADYVNEGVTPCDAGYKLAFDREVEYNIFRAVPHQLPTQITALTVPTALIYGLSSNVVSQSVVNYLKKRYGVMCFPMAGTHMLPMESPDLLAEMLFRVLDDIS